ncbi:hypothetical protein N8912_00705 [Rhodobacteraceae bacterium]|nr:hypothetical protein [Paracoccaceae bacterium]
MKDIVEGRKGRSKENFGKWVNNNFPNLLETVSKDDQEEERETILLVLGRQLLEGRKLHEGDREFGKWCSRNFPNLREHVSFDEQVAIIWAAEFPEQRAMTAAALANMTQADNQWSAKTNSSELKSTKDSADQLNVGTTAVKIAKAIKRDAPDLADEVCKALPS